jgi:uncharacterized membrane-anchored protein YjiN (DUF445 family)
LIDIKAFDFLANRMSKKISENAYSSNSIRISHLLLDESTHEIMPETIKVLPQPLPRTFSQKNIYKPTSKLSKSSSNPILPKRGASTLLHRKMIKSQISPSLADKLMAGVRVQKQDGLKRSGSQASCESTKSLRSI